MFGRPSDPPSRPRTISDYEQCCACCITRSPLSGGSLTQEIACSGSAPTGPELMDLGRPWVFGASAQSRRQIFRMSSNCQAGSPHRKVAKTYSLARSGSLSSPLLLPSDLAVHRPLSVAGSLARSILPGKMLSAVATSLKLLVVGVTVNQFTERGWLAQICREETFLIRPR